MTARIFDIQRFSVHDGPGIRTTVFFKGCPLRCRWCHNPEGLSREIGLRFEANRCIGCRSCSEPKRMEDADGCPSGALSLCGRDVTEEALLEAVLKDRIYYEEGGGVTVSGGECLLQADFVARLLGRLKEMGIHTAIDTAGCVPFSEIEKTLAVCDLYLYDVKCISPQLHLAYTGRDNSRILDNLHRLSQRGARIWIRVPVIPGFNDREDEMRAIADCIAPLSGIEQVTLMPYHSLGASKYTALGMEYPFDATASIGAEAMERFIGIMKARSLPIT